MTNKLNIFHTATTRNSVQVSAKGQCVDILQPVLCVIALT